MPDKKKKKTNNTKNESNNQWTNCSQQECENKRERRDGPGGEDSYSNSNLK